MHRKEIPWQRIQVGDLIQDMCPSFMKYAVVRHVGKCRGCGSGPDAVWGVWCVTIEQALAEAENNDWDDWTFSSGEESTFHLIKPMTNRSRIDLAIEEL